MSCQIHIKQGDMVLFRGKHPLFKYLNMKNRIISLIIVTLTIRRTSFSHYHSEPSDRYIGVHKTMHRLYIRFFLAWDERKY